VVSQMRLGRGKLLQQLNKGAFNLSSKGRRYLFNSLSLSFLHSSKQFSSGKMFFPEASCIIACTVFTTSESLIKISKIEGLDSVTCLEASRETASASFILESSDACCSASTSCCLASASSLFLATASSLKVMDEERPVVLLGLSQLDLH